MRKLFEYRCEHKNKDKEAVLDILIRVEQTARGLISRVQKVSHICPYTRAAERITISEMIRLCGHQATQDLIHNLKTEATLDYLILGDDDNENEYPALEGLLPQPRPLYGREV